MKTAISILAVFLLVPAAILSGIASLVSGCFAVIKRDSQALKKIWIVFDQVFNAAFNGSPDETISARAWRLRNDKQHWAMARLVIDALFLPWEKNHCKSSYESELQRKQLPENYRL